MSPQTDDLQAWLQNLGIEPPKAPKKKAKPPTLKKSKAKVKAKKKVVPPVPMTPDNDAYNCVENAETEAQDVAAYTTDNNAYIEEEVNNDVHSSQSREKKKEKHSKRSLFTASNLKNAIIIQEVLGKPKSLR